MSSGEVPVIEQSILKVRLWLEEVAAELGRPHDQRYALHVLRGFLRTLRDRLPVPEIARFSAQLPATLHGLYYKQWLPSRVPERCHDLDTFLERLAETGQLAGETEAAFATEGRRSRGSQALTPHQLTKVGAVLPRGIADLLSYTSKEPQDRAGPSR